VDRSTYTFNKKTKRAFIRADGLIPAVLGNALRRGMLIEKNAAKWYSKKIP